ncbi:protease modulator HflK [Paraurantiacibacter namhicola]|uniref:FtsH protease regulator HflK n=1 Tax=Paraurantiacibacter namhicola TaxID=645517 RepID=A0A1C7D6P4_9SPHN|nr:protease modulator HflK [Paraurantiacibacter namhicola]ANU07130.1 FtsH protease regulator HflK [Paraurantiacibacter namhicola]
MRTLGGFFDQIALAMAGRKNPWGGKSGGNDGDGGGEGGGDGAGSGDGPSSAGGDGSRGPKNPWLPGGKSTGDGGRKGANIEDLFKNKGPEGPRRRLGGGGPGGGFTLPQRPGGKSWLPFGIALVAGIWLLLSSIHQVGPKEQGLVTTFGKYSRTLEPGLNWTFPWPFQNVDIETVSVFRETEIDEKLFLTGDQNLVNLNYSVRWSIKDLQGFRFQIDNPDLALQNAAEAAMRASVAEQDFDTVLSGEGRAQIEQDVRDRMQEILDSYGAGIQVQGVYIEKTDPPPTVVEAFNDVLAAQQDAEANLNQARRYAQQLLAGAEGNAAAFNKIYAEYRLAPEVTRRRLYYETMEYILAKTDKTVVEAGGVTTYLPLPEVQRRSQGAAQPATPTQPATSANGGQ